MKFPRHPKELEVGWELPLIKWMEAVERNMRVTRHMVWICLVVGYVLGIVIEVFVK